MSILNKLKSDDTIENEKDSVGGSGPLASGLYQATIKMAYVTTAASGAIGLVTHLATDKGEHRETLWMTSGTAKGGNNYYLTKDGEKRYLPGFLNANALALLTVGKEISELDTEKKVTNVYNPELKKEVATQVDVPVDLLNKEVLIGIIKETVPKNTKDADGNYVPTGETREQATLDKVFRASDKKTTAEIRSEDEASFYEVWNDKWEGKVRDRTKGVTASTPAANSQVKKPTTSLFG